jgi:hypothetical protein
MFVNTLAGIVSAPTKDVLNYNSEFAVISSLPKEFNDIIDCSLMFLKSDSKDVTFFKLVKDGEDTVKFLDTFNIKAFLTNFVLDVILVKS